jgi:cell division protein FtsI/penicillin-binding protein 2
MNKRLKKRHQTNIKYNYYRKYKNIKETIEKRYSILIGVITFIVFILFANLFFIQIIQKDYYVNKVKTLSQNIINGNSAPRGRIYDRNHKLIVDNKPVKIIYYKKQPGVTTKQEIELAYQISEMLELKYSSISQSVLKDFWLKNYPDLGKSKITSEEWQQLDERKLTRNDIERLKLERITEEELDEFSLDDKEAAYIYSLMNKGYSYSEKIIKKDNISDQEYALISENAHLLNGFNTRLDWERVYPYGNVFKTILGSVSTSESGLPSELKDYYVSKGYSLNDRVGISYLEYQYEEYLKGEKNQYEVLSNGDYKLLKEGKRGNDIVITIDIELQKEVERIITEELIKAKEEPNTEYYNRSFVVITDPNTGEVLAMAGKQIVKTGDKYEIYDYTPGVTTSPVVVGSVVKGASHIVGYNTGSLKIGEIRDDNCIKIAQTPLKCSWKYLGKIDDIKALKSSSNTYQFNTAIKVGKGTYIYDKPLRINEEAFDTYRSTFAEFGLGIKTGIDLPVESLGYKGSSKLPGHLMDFSIGQYDTYTPIQLAQYIGAIANGGYRMQPFLLKSVYDSKSVDLKNIILTNEPVVLNKVDTDDKYMSRVQEGFKEVLMPGGTGYNFMPPSIKPAGKTGTSQSFIDSTLDGIIDKETISNAFVGYAPYDNPMVTFTVISPDISHYDNKSTYQTNVNSRITNQVSKKFFEIYK